MPIARVRGRLPPLSYKPELRSLRLRYEYFPLPSAFLAKQNTLRSGAVPLPPRAFARRAEFQSGRTLSNPATKEEQMDIPTDRTTTEYWEIVLTDAIADWTLKQMELGKIEAIEPYCGCPRREYLRHKLAA
jgi:hypothetical protein